MLYQELKYSSESELNNI